ncbi:MAG TPA: chromosome segregation ATPase [Leptolyngbyaceae cyanobacterium M65_K2018_010]|nr:chromosome segregation ATPase [Leptolyngbyaceae cyanobacterium M65_K2018_010]
MAQNRSQPGRFSYQEPDPSPVEPEVEDWPTDQPGADLGPLLLNPPKTPRYDPLEELRQRTGNPTPGETRLLKADRPQLPLGRRLAKHWPLWLLGLLVGVAGVGVVSAISLFRIPNLPNCRAIFWPTASATTRIQCAEAYAEQGTVEGYLDAIALLESLPDDHPLRGEISQRIETWSENILDLAENTFQAGQLQEAIGIARRIPNHTAAAQVVNQRVSEWNQIWEEAETLYAAAENDLTNLQFQDAFSKATQLLTVRNRYWKTTKYDELVQNITAAREDLNELGRAKRLAAQRTLDALKEALTIAQGIANDSPVYAEAQRVLRSFGQDLLSMAEAALDRKDATAAQQMLDAIPLELNLGEEIADMRVIIAASQLSWQGGVTGLEGAIVRLQSIGNGRPLYGKAQSLMGRWQDEVEGRSQLEWARQVALPSTPADLRAAMAEADKISRSNPAWPDAKAQIDRWRGQIETTEDRPILDEARQFAQAGNLTAAIATVRQIAPGRALYGEAQDLLRGWRNELQRAEDGPLLTQAQQLAAAGRLQEAIAMANRIGQGRVLYDQAQTNMATWRGQLEGQQQLQQAYQLAQRGTVSALVEAIQVAQQVPNSSPQKSEANQILNRWSFDLLRLAESEARSNLNRAIEIAASIPPQTEAYAQAQLRLREWQVGQGQSLPEGNGF